MFNLSKAQTIKPYRYWNFDTEGNKDIIVSQILGGNCASQRVNSLIGRGMDLRMQPCITITNALRQGATDQFSFGFLFKGESFFFLTFSQQSMFARFIYPSITFKTSVHQNGKIVSDNLVVELNGAGRKSYNYYTDGKWHLLFFIANAKTGKKEIWVDGECMAGFSKQAPTGSKFEFDGSDGFRDTDQIDEVAFYNRELSAADIKLLFYNVSQGKNYTVGSLTGKIAAASTSKNSALPRAEAVDAKEFAPGYPVYTVQATDQLKSFPAPRFNPAVQIKRNMSWMDITYLHRELPGNGGAGFGKQNSFKAIEISQEMAVRWNYYLDIPTVRGTAEYVKKVYEDKTNFYGALIDFANRHPEYPTASIVMQIQGRPEQAGFNRKTAYVSAQDLPNQYYIKNGQGIPVASGNRKLLSPLMPLDIVQKDAQVSRFYLDQLLKYLKRPPTLLNENGEIFGHFIKEDILKQDPDVWRDYTKSGLTASQYRGRFQYRMDSVYRSTILRGLNPAQTHFSFYNVSAFNPDYWPNYKMRRMVNIWEKGVVFPTPDFYPARPDNWRNAQGSYNGYGTIARGRVEEMRIGDMFFSPFVSAGWGREEANIRPAQWLALLKAMVMLGADFFYVGYFNVTGAGGKWPNGAGPNDPRGYAYQIAMPAYAQAIRTWVPDFFVKGNLLNPADSKDLVRQFRFKGQAENELILVRKLGKKYLIYGSIQPNANVVGNVPAVVKTAIQIEDISVEFDIRRQGSMYIFDLSGVNPLFYQIDAWHQYEHPYYWNKDVVLEAELGSLENKTGQLVPMRRKSETNKLSPADIAVRLIKSSVIRYSIPLNPGTYIFSIQLSAVDAGAKKIMYRVNGEAGVKELVSQSNEQVVDLKTIRVNNAGEYRLELEGMNGLIDVDKIILKKIQ